jgi:nucleotide-binding universal stress UspA family protein
MFKHILLPVDLSDKHQQAMTTAVELAQQAGGQITLLHVIEVIAGLSLEEEKPFYRGLEKAARDHLGRLGEHLKSQRITWQAEVRLGHRAPEVVRYAQERGADLIVLTSPPVDPKDPGPGWGSLSYKIGVLSATPVLLVK